MSQTSTADFPYPETGKVRYREATFFGQKNMFSYHGVNSYTSGDMKGVKVTTGSMSKTEDWTVGNYLIFYGCADTCGTYHTEDFMTSPGFWLEFASRMRIRILYGCREIYGTTGIKICRAPVRKKSCMEISLGTSNTRCLEARKVTKKTQEKPETF